MTISNLLPNSGKPYEIVQEGFRPGAVQYIDRGYTLASVPDSLLDQTYIKTSGSDKMYEEHEECLSFVVDCPVTVCILHADKFETKPKWLHEFKPTGEKVTRTDNNVLTS